MKSLDCEYTKARSKIGMSPKRSETNQYLERNFWTESPADVLPAQAQAFLEIWEHRYKKSKNPLYAWLAFQQARKLDLAVPAWVLDYFQKTADNLLKIPGGKDGFIDSVEAGFAKVAFGLLLGAVAGAAGTGRLRGAGRRIEDFPRFADLITAVPRGSVISILEDFMDAPPAEQQNIELVMNKLAENPGFFGKDITLKLQSAMENNRFAEELRALQKDRKFKQKLFSLKPPDLTTAQRGS